MQDPTAAPPWTVRYKPRRKYARWVVVGTVPTHREAVGLIGSLPDGDWWLSDRPDVDGRDIARTGDEP